MNKGLLTVYAILFALGVIACFIFRDVFHGDKIEPPCVVKPVVRADVPEISVTGSRKGRGVVHVNYTRND